MSQAEAGIKMALALNMRRTLSSVRGKLSYLRLQPFETTSAEGRAAERQRRIALSATASMAAKIIAISTALISVPLTLHYLGIEQYGMWMILSSLAASFTFADLGVGNGILNQVARLLGEDDFDGIRRVVSSGYAILTAIAVIILLVFAAAYNFVPWYAIFNAKTVAAKAEAGPAVAAFVTCFALAMPLGVVQKVQIGLQRGFMASIWQCVASIVGLIGVLTCIWLKVGLFWLIFALMGEPLVAALLNSIIFFGFIHREISPRLSLVSQAVCRNISQTGAMFFILQIVAAASFTTDAIILAQVLGASIVAQYSVPEKLFALIATVLAMMQNPLWPAYGEAVARGDYDWIERTLRRSQFFAFAFCALASTLLIMCAPTILHFWVHGAVKPPLMLLIGLGVWKIVEGQGNAMAMFFNGANQMRFLVGYSIATAIAAVLFKILLANIFGVSGTVWGTIAAYSIFMLAPSYIHIHGYFRKLARN